jgi:26S proteasome regulatory subunit N5
MSSIYTLRHSQKLLVSNHFHRWTQTIMSGSAGASGTASGGQLEEKIDLSAETDAKLEQGASLISHGNLRDALSLLAGHEKRCRTLNDSPSLVRVCEASIEYCYQLGDYDALISTLNTLVTRRSQKTAAIQAMVRKAIAWCVQAPYTPFPVSDQAEKINRDKLTTVLREITDGRIFLERERAQLTRALATIKVRTDADENPGNFNFSLY